MPGGRRDLRWLLAMVLATVVVAGFMAVVSAASGFSTMPSDTPTGCPTVSPEPDPTPTVSPEPPPTGQPTEQPTGQPTEQPTGQPPSGPPATVLPTRTATSVAAWTAGKGIARAAEFPTGFPTEFPSERPTADPTTDPTTDPTSDPVPSASADPCADVPVFGDDGTCLGSSNNCDEYFEGGGNDDPDPRDGTIPVEKPVLVAIGDSVTSGHHKERNKNTECDDRDYAYGNGLFEKMNKEKPLVWSDRDQYQNFAHSGFGTVEVLGGGTNGCGQKFEGDETPIKKAVKVLTDHKEKGNFVVMSAGINDTNWVDVLKGITTVTILNKGLPNAARCETLLLDGSAANPKFDGFNFYDDAGFPKPRRDAIAALQKKVKDNMTDIVKKLVAADPKVHIVILNYYNASGTGFSPVAAFNGYKGPFLPDVCKDPVQKRLDSANVLLKDGARAAFDNAADFTARVSIAAVADLNDPKKGMLQSLFLDEALKKDAQPPGWPHPNEKGHDTIATDMFAIVKPKL